MIRYNNYLDKHGFPKISTPNNEIKIKYINKVFLFAKFIRRFDICLKLYSFNVIRGYYHDQILESYYYDKLRTVVFFKKFLFKINFKLLSIFIYLFYQKKKIKLNNYDICLFGPYSHSYSHILHEFIVRLIFLKNKNFKNNVWVPDNLKALLVNKIYKKIFTNLNIKFFPTNKNIIFENCSYLTHSNNRWYFKKKLKFISREYLKLINQFRNDVFENHNLKKIEKFKYIIISRSKATSRRLLNETELFQKLRPYNFKLICFEDYNFHEQINIARNCKIMLGYHGAGLTNLFFMQPKSSIVEIYNKNYDHKHFKFFSQCLNLNYKNFLCKENYRNLDGECDSEKILKYIKKII